MTSIFYGWWIVVACFLIAFYIGGACFYGFTAFFEPIVAEFGWSYTQVSIAFSLRGLEMGILAPIVGFLVDRFGSRKLASAGTFIVGGALILLGVTSSLFMFYAAFVLLALGASGCASTVLMTAVAQWFRKNVGKAMGIVACGFGAGGLLVPVIVRLIDLHTWRTTLIILGLGMWALGVPLSFVIRNRPEQYGSFPDGTDPAERSFSHGGDPKGEPNVKEVLKGKNFWAIGVTEAIRMMIGMAVVTHVMPYLSSIGISRSTSAFVATSIPLFSIIGRLGFGWLGDIFDKRYVLAVAYFLLGTGMLVFSSIHLNWLIFPFLILFSPAFGGILSLRGAIVREYFGRASFGRIIGLILGLAAIGGVIGPSAAGWTFDNLGGYRPIWFLFAGTTVIALMLIFRLEAPSRGQKAQLTCENSPKATF
jgi:MFS family permease